MKNDKRCFVFNDIEIREFCGAELLKAKPIKTESFKFYNGGDVCLFEDIEDAFVFKYKTLGCPKIMNTWRFYIEDKKANNFKKVFKWITKPYLKYIADENLKKVRLERENERLKNHINKYLPDHELVVDWDDRIHYKPKGMKLIK